MITLVLPLPPSINAAYRNTKRGRAKTRECDDWIRSAGFYLMQQKEWKKHKITGPFELKIKVPQDMRGDIDNRVKLILDILGPKNLGATPDDRHAQRVSIERSAEVPEFDCYVTVRAA